MRYATALLSISMTIEKSFSILSLMLIVWIVGIIRSSDRILRCRQRHCRSQEFVCRMYHKQVAFPRVLNFNLTHPLLILLITRATAYIAQA